MHKFTDDMEREWKIILNTTIMEEISDGLDIDLFEPIKDDGNHVLLKIVPTSKENIARFVSMLFMICEFQCKEHDITPKLFGQGLGGTGLKAATTAFYEEWMDFFQCLDRTDLVEALAKFQGTIKDLTTMVAERIKNVTMEEVKEEMKRKLNSGSETPPIENSSTSSPES